MDYKEKVIALLNSQELSKEQKEKLENIFPELAESEDEITRKSLIRFLKSPFVNKNITDEKVAPWIAWIEKQGEQKQTWKPSAAQLIVIKDLMEDKNTSNVNRVILRGMLNEFKQFTNTHKREIDYYECKNSRDQD